MPGKIPQRAICAAICLFFFLPAFTQDRQTTRKMDELLDSRFKPAQPGCVVLVAKKGEVAYRKAFGSANLQLNVPMKPEMIFNIASITKQFTAIAILRLMEQGKLALGDSIQKFVPDYPFKGQPITIEHLLTHTSGIPDYMQLDYKSPNMERWDFRPAQLIDSFKHRPLQFEPGSKFAYSNSGYYILGYIIQKVSGRAYQDYIVDSLLAPLGMKHTGFDRNGVIVAGRVSGYVKSGTGFRNEEYWSPTIEYAAGGLLSNVDDLLRWHKGLYSYQLVGKETLEKAFTPYRLKDGSFSNYGYGWYLKESNGIRSIEHQGGLPGFVTNEIYYPETDVFVVILSNTGATPIDDLSLAVSGLALGRPMQQNVKIDETILDKYAGTYRLTADTSRKMVIRKEGGQLVAAMNGSQKLLLLFQSETRFQFAGLRDAQCEFVVEGGKVTKFKVEQNGKFEWMRIE